MKIKGDNPAIEKPLLAMRDIIVEGGGWVDPELVVSTENGGISLEKHGFCNPTKPLIVLPVEHLLNMEEAGARIENDEFLSDPQPGKLTDVQRHLTDLMFEVYNHTKKAALHRESCLWFAFRNVPDIMLALLKARTPYLNQERYIHFAQDSTPRADYNVFLCETFFKSRTIGYKHAAQEDKAKKQAIPEAGELNEDAQPVGTIARLMPLIDFGNHHPGGAYFQFKTGYKPELPDREFLLLGDSRPLYHTNECFAFYNQLDALDSYITYGFPDMHAQYVRSIPMDFEIAGLGRMVIKSMPTTQHKGKLPEPIAALRPYIPHTIPQIADALAVTHLIIPTNPGTPQALRRVLRILISNRVAQTRSMESSKIWDAVLEAEATIIEKNVEFYREFLAWLDERQKQPDAKENMVPINTARYVAELQLMKLFKYNFDESHFTGELKDQQDPASMAAAE